MAKDLENDEILEEDDEQEEVSSKAKGKAAKSDKDDGKKKKKKTKRNPIVRWFKEMRSELKRVSWPTRKEIINNTLVSLVVMSVSGVVLWGVDNLATQIFQAIRVLLDKAS